MAFSEVLGEALVPIRAQMDKLREDLQSAKQQVERDLGKAFSDVGKTLKDAGQKLSTYVTLPIVGAGAAAVKLAGDFEYSMNVLRAVSGATNEQLEQMRRLAIELGNDMTLPGTSAIDAAEALTELVKAGLSVEQAMKAARGVLVMSAAAEISNAEAAQIAANALNAFGLSGDQATRVADLLANAANAASGEMTDIAYALRQAAAVAHMAGQSIEDVVTAIGLMANAGIQGSDAGTSLKQMFLSLINPTKKAKELMADLGIELFTASGQLKPLPQLIEEFRGALSGLPPAQRNAALATIFGSDAIRAANIVLMAGTQEWNTMREAVTRAGGAQDVAAAKMEGFRGALEGLKSTLETLAITMGTYLLPPLTEAVRWLADMVDRVAALPQPVQVLILAVAGLAAALGPLLIGLGAVTAAIGSLMTTGPALAAAFGTVLGAALPVVGVLAALAAVAYLIWRNWDTVGPELAALWEQVKARVQPAIAAMRQAIADVVEYVQARWPQIRQTLQAFFDWVEPVFRFVWETVKSTVLFYVQAIAGVIQGFVNVVTGIIKLFAAILSGDWKGAWEAVKQIVSGAVQALWNLFKLWLWGKIASLIGGWLGSILGRIRSWAGQMLQPVVSFLSRMGQSVSSWMGRVVGLFRGALGNVQGAVAAGLARVVGFFRGFVDDALRPIINMGSRLWSIGRNLVESLWRGISSLASWLKNKLLGFAKNIIPGPIARALGISSPSKLMMGFGEEVVRGLALGMERNARQVAQAAQLLAAQVAQVSGAGRVGPVSVAAASPAAVGVGVAAGPAMPVIQIQQMVVRSEEDIYAISRQLYQLSRSRLRAYGQGVRR